MVNIIRTLCATLALGLVFTPAGGAVPKAPIPGLSCATIYPQAPIPGIPSMDVAVMRLVYGPDVHGPDHVHDTDEYVSVLSGRGTLVTKGARRSLRPNTTVVVAAGVVHEIDNASTTTPLVYLSFKIGKPHPGDDDIRRPRHDAFNHCPRLKA